MASRQNQNSSKESTESDLHWLPSSLLVPTKETTSTSSLSSSSPPTSSLSLSSGSSSSSSSVRSTWSPSSLSSRQPTSTCSAQTSPSLSNSALLNQSCSSSNSHLEHHQTSDEVPVEPSSLLYRLSDLFNDFYNQNSILFSPDIYPPEVPLYDHPSDSSSNSRAETCRSFDINPDFILNPDDPLCFKHSEFGFDPLRSSVLLEENHIPKAEKVEASSDPLGDTSSSSTIFSKNCEAAENEDRSEFGWDGNGSLVENYLWSSKFNSKSKANLCPDDGNYRTYLTTYFSYLLLFLIGHVRDAIGKRLFPKDYEQLMPHNGYAALNSDFGSFFTRRVKSKLDDCFSRPVTGPPGRTIKLLDRTSLDYCFNFKFTHTITQALNIASYNYLGFAQSRGRCAHAVERDILKSGVFSGGSGATVGLMTQHVKAEKLLASFLGVQDSIIISQGFATNSTTLPALVGPGCLIISDELNHASIRFGARLSGAMVRTYKHNNMRDLERVLRNSISHGQTRKLRGWKKIIVAVEGLYSMEGSIVDLPGLLRLREKFKFYLYLDEAHSIGALGPNGRGVCDYYGVDPNRVDILMGTLTKSFGASGGYIAGSKLLIDHLRRKSHSSVYAESLSPAVLTQITTSMKLIAGKDLDDQSNASNNAENNKGDKTDCDGSLNSRVLDHRSLGEGQIRLKRLAFNSRYLHAGLKKLGFIVPGDMDSPIVPLLVFQPGKLLLFSRLMLQRYSIVVVVVGYPATPIVSGRVRFCVSACHTKEDIDKVLIATDEIGEMLGLKLAKYSSGNQSSKSTRKGKGCFTFWKIEEVISRARELVYDYQID